MISNANRISGADSNVLHPPLGKMLLAETLFAPLRVCPAMLCSHKMTYVTHFETVPPSDARTSDRTFFSFQNVLVKDEL